MSERFEKWREAVAPGESIRAIAGRMGADQKTVGRHLSHKPPVPETVIEMARAYGANPAAGLVAAGHLKQEEVNGAASDTQNALVNASDIELLAELMGRAAKKQERTNFTRGLRE